MRKGRPKKRILLPDPKYKDRLVTQFVNNLMFSGKKRRENSAGYMETGTKQHYPSGRGEEPQGRWSNFPGTHRGSAGKKGFSQYETYDQFRQTAFRPVNE